MFCFLIPLFCAEQKYHHPRQKLKKNKTTKAQGPDKKLIGVMGGGIPPPPAPSMPGFDEATPRAKQVIAWLYFIQLARCVKSCAPITVNLCECAGNLCNKLPKGTTLLLKC